MGIWERLGNVIKSYLNDDEETRDRSGPAGYGPRGGGDPDLDAAYEELDDFLKGGTAHAASGGRAERVRPVPAELRGDFAELGLTPEATPGECKEAYKKFLKVYHPDRHAGNPDDMKKATEKTAQVNAAYDRLERWFRSSGDSK